MAAAAVTTAGPPAAALYDLITGAWIARMVTVLAELGIADAMPEDAAVSVTELAAATGTDPDALNRVLRVLAAKGVVACDGDRYRHTELSRPLRRDHPTSVRNIALIAGAPWQWRAWIELPDAVLTGTSPFAAANGKPTWAYFADDDPAAGVIFQQAMSDLSKMTDAPLADALDVATARTVVDVGGGHGNLLAAVTVRNPHLKAVLFESPATLDSLAADPQAAAHAKSFALVAGDFRDAVPVRADVYLLKLIVHLVDDEMAVRILRNCAASATPGARVVVVERVVTDGPDSISAKISDVQMLVLEQQGRERTEQEFADLFERAGLRFSHFTPTPSGMCLFEARL